MGRLETTFNVATGTTVAVGVGGTGVSVEVGEGGGGVAVGGTAVAVALGATLWQPAAAMNSIKMNSLVFMAPPLGD